MNRNRKNRPAPTIPVFTQTPGVVFQPDTYQSFQRGISQIVDAIRPTLGPNPRLVAIERYPNTRQPELLDDGGVIARRIIDLQNPDENAGAMFLRAVLWRLYEQVGDGAATAAVLFEAIYNEGVKYITAGGNAMLLKGALERGLSAVLSELDQMTQPVRGKTDLARVAEAVCYDPELADALGEVFDLIGEFGLLDIRPGRHRDIHRQYIEGNYWAGGLSTPSLYAEQAQPLLQLEDAAIVISDLEIEEPNQLVQVLQAAVQEQVHALFIMCAKVSEKVNGVLSQSLTSTKLRIVPVKTPGIRSDDQMEAMQDLAALTGGISLVKAAGETLASFTPAHFGQARRIWADADYLGILSGKGDPRQLRRHISALKQAYYNTKDSERRQKLQQRIGRLSCGSAVLEIGGMTESEINARQELGKRTAGALRSAVREGVVPGGGTALLACRQAVKQAFPQLDDPDERAAYHILTRALELPFRTILHNSGYEAGPVISALETSGPGWGFDVLSGKLVNMASASILDVAAVQKNAVRSAIQSAALALTVDILIHKRKPTVLAQPDAPGI
jgi:chaperonin GroEL